MTVKARKGKPMRSISSTKWRRGQGESFIIQSDIPRSSVNKDMYCERTRQDGS